MHLPDKNMHKLCKVFGLKINLQEIWEEGSGVSLGTELGVIFWVYVMPQFIQGLGVMTLHHSEAQMVCTF